ncbi:permease prefix domain 1-containing protein [Alkalibacillus salilacus]|uniref:Cytoskeletal protein RodZ n=1 Tax=Alkalibacillus salilacus TaxID=284582 RepID=A0ABT9VET4_9BACI|nr:permease prefix domain 1-containing protein [Alkalibacillus salilacus]MDQ0159486.1 cytoskeletal protein RodZ [Alkalibacillus salilacus]
MKKIDKYIDSVYQDFDGTEEEIKELKEEMRSHLLELVEEIKADGKSEKEAVQIALDRFGNQTELSNGLMEFFEGQQLFAKKLLRFSISVFIIGLIALSWVAITSPDANKERIELSDRIAKQINDDAELSLEEKDQIKKQISSFNGKSEIIHLSIYYSEEGIEEAFPANVQDAEYVYLGMEPASSEEVVTKGYPLNDTWFVQMQQNEKKSYWQYLIPFTLFIVFGVLITIWLLLNSYIKKYIKEVL